MNRFVCLMLLILTSAPSYSDEYRQSCVEAFKAGRDSISLAFNQCSRAAKSGDYVSQYIMYVLHTAQYANKNSSPLSRKHGVSVNFKPDPDKGYAYLSKLLSRGSRTAKILAETMVIRELSGYLSDEDVEFIRSERLADKQYKRLIESSDPVIRLRAILFAKLHSGRLFISPIPTEEVISETKNVLNELADSPGEHKLYVSRPYIKLLLDLLGSAYESGEGIYQSALKAYAYKNAAGTLKQSRATHASLAFLNPGPHFSEAITGRLKMEAESLTGDIYKRYLDPFSLESSYLEAVLDEAGRI